LQRSAGSAAVERNAPDQKRRPICSGSVEDHLAR
jgi:hypothetical protein